MDNIDFAFNEIEAKIINDFPVVEIQTDVLNIIDFSKEIIKIDLWPRQKFALKIFYSLPLDEEEKLELKWLEENKGIKIPENYEYITFNELVLVIGRRGSKSVVASLIATYEIYKLLKLNNPQKFYGLIPGTPIYILHCAAEEDQAKGVQDYIKGYIQGSDWFKEYVDTMLEKEIRFFTKFDKETNYPKGTIRVFSLTSNSSSIPGRTAKVVILDEIARMMNTKGRLSGNEIYDALTPSVKTFKDDGKIISISSPRAESGIFYELYLKSQSVKGMLCFKYSSWEFNKNLTKEDFISEFEKDPEMAAMEYGAEFGKVVNKAFDWSKIDKIIDSTRFINFIGNQNYLYVITCDPATVNDRYGISWGHIELMSNQRFVIIDGLKYYESEKNNEGAIVKEIDLDMVDNFVIGLIKMLGNVGCIAYDQGKSTASIQKLKKLNYNAIETTFTNKYKETLYLDMKNILNQERLKVYCKDEQNAVQLFINEMKYVQRIIEGNLIKIGAPTIGAVTTDDLYSCASNLNHILLSDNVKQIVKQPTIKPRIFTTHHLG